ncbi:hypothetical protein [Vibrio sonorensis]|uniref:hypothetical protein n=1 Tax=Vibrio sonorensis TaxID=1004316 RepID=UPI0008D9DE53|nr:hypothetical protein [Vibrio sonorensis]
MQNKYGIISGAKLYIGTDGKVKHRNISRNIEDALKRLTNERGDISVSSTHTSPYLGHWTNVNFNSSKKEITFETKTGELKRNYEVFGNTFVIRRSKSGDLHHNFPFFTNHRMVYSSKNLIVSVTETFGDIFLWKRKGVKSGSIEEKYFINKTAYLIREDGLYGSDAYSPEMLKIHFRANKTVSITRDRGKGVINGKWEWSQGVLSITNLSTAISGKKQITLSIDIADDRVFVAKDVEKPYQNTTPLLVTFDPSVMRNLIGSSQYYAQTHPTTQADDGKSKVNTLKHWMIEKQFTKMPMTNVVLAKRKESIYFDKNGTKATFKKNGVVVKVEYEATKSADYKGRFKGPFAKITLDNKTYQIFQNGRMLLVNPPRDEDAFVLYKENIINVPEILEPIVLTRQGTWIYVYDKAPISSKVAAPDWAKLTFKNNGRVIIERDSQKKIVARWHIISNKDEHKSIVINQPDSDKHVWLEGTQKLELGVLVSQKIQERPNMLLNIKGNGVEAIRYMSTDNSALEFLKAWQKSSFKSGS